MSLRERCVGFFEGLGIPRSVHRVQSLEEFVKAEFEEHINAARESLKEIEKSVELRSAWEGGVPFFYQHVGLVQGSGEWWRLEGRFQPSGLEMPKVEEEPEAAPQVPEIVETAARRVGGVVMERGYVGRYLPVERAMGGRLKLSEGGPVVGFAWEPVAKGVMPGGACVCKQCGIGILMVTRTGNYQCSKCRVQVVRCADGCGRFRFENSWCVCPEAVERERKAAVAERRWLRRDKVCQECTGPLWGRPNQMQRMVGKRVGLVCSTCGCVNVIGD